MNFFGDGGIRSPVSRLGGELVSHNTTDARQMNYLFDGFTKYAMYVICSRAPELPVRNRTRITIVMFRGVGLYVFNCACGCIAIVFRVLDPVVIY